MSQTTEQLTYSVPGISCDHCRAAVSAGVSSVDVDLEAMRVTVAGEQLDDAAVRAAVDEAGYDIA
jgi:copper chaperone